MGPWRRVLIGAWVLVSAATTFVPAAHGQFYDDARRANGLGPDPLARSPRMVGMGRMTLVIDDVHLRNGIWEFSGNPAGVMDSDSVSTFELGPGTAANSTVHDQPSGATSRERQDFALREFRNSYEALRRTPDGTSFGLVGELGRLRTDSPLSVTAERRSEFMTPRTTFVVSGKLPLFLQERIRYGLAFIHRYQSQDDNARNIVSNAAGDYIDQDGAQLLPTVALLPTHFGTRSLGVRIGLLMNLAQSWNVAGGYEHLSNSIEGRNDAARNSAEFREDRPYGTWSAAASGRSFGLSFVGDASRWRTGQTDQRWAASFSTGTGSPPLSGRGLLQRRLETGHEYRGRASWKMKFLTLAAGGSSFRREASTKVPPADDRTSFNYFLNSLSTRPGADSLSLPDSVRANATTETGSEYGVGAAIELPWRKAILAAEYHGSKGTLDQLLSGEGPARKDWDYRVGLELPASSVLRLRAGYIYRWLDTDENLLQNEFISNSVTGGFGYEPRGALWTFDAGYQIRWGKADFGDPTRQRSSEQAGVVRLRWIF